MDDADNKFRRCIQFELVAGKKINASQFSIWNRSLLYEKVYSVSVWKRKKKEEATYFSY